MMLSLLSPSMFSKARGMSLDVFSPIIKAFSIPLQSASIALNDMSNLSQLQAENARLKEENDKLEQWHQTALFLESDNKALRSLLNVKNESLKTIATARVLSDSGNRFVKTFLVNAGSLEGIQKEQAVMTGKGMIGRVIEVGKSISRILLVTDINSRIPVMVVGSNQHAILVGNNTADPVLKYVDKGSRIENGARIITSGQGGVFPLGLPVGEVFYEKNSSYKVKLHEDLGQLVYVKIIAGTHLDKNLGQE